jgi:hypothetical protein
MRERFWTGASLRLKAASTALVAILALAGAGTASADVTDMATGGVEYQLDWTAGSVSISLVARGTPASAAGRIEYRRVAPGFDANSGGTVTCYLQVGSRGYFSGTFDRPFLSGPTEIRFFSGTVIDGDQMSGGVDRAFVALGADSPIPCADPGTMSFLDAMSANSPVTQGNIQVH